MVLMQPDLHRTLGALEAKVDLILKGMEFAREERIRLEDALLNTNEKVTIIENRMNKAIGVVVALTTLFSFAAQYVIRKFVA